MADSQSFWNFGWVDGLLDRGLEFGNSYLDRMTEYELSKYDLKLANQAREAEMMAAYEAAYYQAALENSQPYQGINPTLIMLGVGGLALFAVLARR